MVKGSGQQRKINFSMFSQYIVIVFSANQNGINPRECVATEQEIHGESGTVTQCLSYHCSYHTVKLARTLLCNTNGINQNSIYVTSLILFGTSTSKNTRLAGQRHSE